MKHALLIVLALLCATITRPARAQTSPDLEKAIADLESKWAAAQKDGKADVVGPLLSDRFITIGTDGKLATKNELLAHMKPGNWDDYGISDVKVIVYGQVAIATGLWTGKGQVGDHKVDIHERWSDTWVHMAGGTWQCVASQQTEIK
jgi:ketosteroid isomerase-like protein